MSETSFFARGPGLTIAELAAICGGEPEITGEADRRLTGIAPLLQAGSADVTFFDNVRYAADLRSTRAGCIIVSPKHRASVPDHLSVLVVRDPQGAFALAGRALYPDALAPLALSTGLSANASIDPSARLEEGVVVEDFAVIGADAEIGRGTVVGAGSLVGPSCRIGRDCRVGAHVTIQHALIGNGVILHPGVRIGQDGFGYATGPTGIVKMVQIGRVIIQDNVEIGANTTVDRGALRDTVIGENTKIDNQVQIAHNVSIGRNCIIVSQVGISGSATIGDGVAIGGQSGVNGHVTVGNGAQIAAVSTVAGDVPAGARWGGTPAHDVRDWFREVTWVRESAKAARKRTRKDDE